MPRAVRGGRVGSGLLSSDWVEYERTGCGDLDRCDG